MHSVSTQMNGTKKPVDLRLNIVKPLGAKWLVDLYDYNYENQTRNNQKWI